MLKDLPALKKSLLITSPVLLIAIVCIVLSVHTITSSSQESSGIWQTSSEDYETPQISAFILYEQYYNATGLDTTKRPYFNQKINLSGVLANWGEDDKFGPYITLYSDNQEKDFIKCFFVYDLDIDLMPTLIGKEITVFGTCQGLVNEYLFIVGSASSDIPQEIKDPSTA